MTLQLGGIELVQAIQAPSNGVPLVAGKATVIRVYLNAEGGETRTVEGTVEVTFADGSVASLSSMGAAKVAVAPDASRRQDIEGSLNFFLPGTTARPGRASIRVTSMIDAGSRQAIGVSDANALEFDLVAGCTLRLRLLGIRYQSAAIGQVVPSQRDVDLILSWLARAYPVSSVEAGYLVVDATGPWPFEATDVNEQLAAFRRLDIQGGIDPRTHYYGLVADGGREDHFMRGKASGIPSSADPSVVASGPTGGAAWGWDADGVYGDWYTGHELGHTFGRRHPGFPPGDQDVDDSTYPYADGQLADAASDAFVGVDVGDGERGIGMAVLPGLAWHDMMTYCRNQWVSAYTYEGILERLAAEDGMVGPADGQALDQELLGMPQARYVQVVASLDLESGRGRIAHVQPTTPDWGARPSQDDDVPATIEAMAADGTVTDSHPVAFRIESDRRPGHETAFLDAVVPISEEAVGLRIVREGEVIGTFERGRPASPVTNVRAMRDADDNLEGVMWDLPEAEDPSVRYTVQVSRDAGQRWETIAVGRPDPHVRLDRDQFPDMDRLRVRVLASDGFETTVESEGDVHLHGELELA